MSKKTARTIENNATSPIRLVQGGEGDREADRHYRDATARFIAEGKVAPAAAEAVRALDDKDERRVLEQAEAAGRAPAEGLAPSSPKASKKKPKTASDAA